MTSDADEDTADVRLATDDGGVATLTLHNPRKLNAMSVAMDRQLNALMRRINNDAEIRVIVLASTGERAFCTGSDLTDLEGYGSSWEYRNRFDRDLDYAIGVWKIRKPVIAALHGYCLGGGLEMACAADIRYATAAARFGAPEIKWGWHGGSGATQFLTRVVGPGHASEMLLTGEQIDADRALRIGLVNDVFADRAAMLDHAHRVARTVAAYAPIPVEAVKKLIRVAQSSSIEVGLAYENDLFTYEMATADAAEGRAAFAEKRRPKFRGK